MGCGDARWLPAVWLCGVAAAARLPLLGCGSAVAARLMVAAQLAVAACALWPVDATAHTHMVLLHILGR